MRRDERSTTPTRRLLKLFYPRGADEICVARRVDDDGRQDALRSELCARVLQQSAAAPRLVADARVKKTALTLALAHARAQKLIGSFSMEMASSRPNARFLSELCSLPANGSQ